MLMSFGSAIRAEEQHRAMEDSNKETSKSSGSPKRVTPRRPGPRPQLPKRVKQMTSKDYMKHLNNQGA